MSDNTAAIREAIAQLQALLDNPPETDYGDGYRIVHLTGYLAEPFGVDMTLSTEEKHADKWEDLAKIVANMTGDPYIEGTTQAIVIVREES